MNTQSHERKPPSDPGAAGDITCLLQHLGADGIEVSEDLINRVYGELKQLASFQLRVERQDHTLQPTALVNEAYLRLIGHGRWANRGHFFRVASKVMRQILVDYARARRAQKRGGNDLVIHLGDSSPELMAYQGQSVDDIIDLDRCLSELAEKDPRQVQIVELRFFGGLSEQEVCNVLNIAPRTVRRDWNSARAEIYGKLKRNRSKEDRDETPKS